MRAGGFGWALVPPCPLHTSSAVLKERAAEQPLRSCAPLKERRSPGPRGPDVVSRLGPLAGFSSCRFLQTPALVAFLALAVGVHARTPDAGRGWPS